MYVVSGLIEPHAVVCINLYNIPIYRIVGKFGRRNFDEFSESFMIHQVKTIQISTYLQLITYWLIY